MPTYPFLTAGEEMEWASVPLDHLTAGKYMAIYHLNLRHCSKNSNQSAKSKYNYITRNEKFSSRVEDLEFSGYGNLPKWSEDNPQIFWQKTDELERANARLCSEIEFALPRELDKTQRAELINDFINKTINNDEIKLTYSFGVHNDKNNNNPHCHLIFSERQNDNIERTVENYFKRANKSNPELGGVAKNRKVKSKDFLNELRKTWADVANDHLKRANVNSRIDERTLEKQGIERKAKSRIDRVTFQKIKERDNLNNEIKKIKDTIKDIELEEKLKIFDFDKMLEQQKIAMKQEQERQLEFVRMLNAKQAEKEQAEKERLAKEQLEKEQAEKERLAKEQLEKEQAEKERLAKEQLEKERLERAKQIEQQRSTVEQKREQRIFDNITLQISVLSSNYKNENETLQRYKKEQSTKQEHLKDINNELDYLNSEKLGVFGLYKSKSQKEKIQELSTSKVKLERSINDDDHFISLQRKKLKSISGELDKLKAKKADKLASNSLLIEKTVEQAKKDMQDYHLSRFNGTYKENTIPDNQKTKSKERGEDFSL